MRITAFFLLIISISGCSVLKEKEGGDSMPLPKRALTEEETRRMAGEAAGNWIFGQGFGEGLLTLGGVIIFPPYALYPLANGIISISGYEPLYLSDALPGDARDVWNTVYNNVTSAPGQMSAALAGQEYRTEEVIKERYRSLFNEVS